MIPEEAVETISKGVETMTEELARYEARHPAPVAQDNGPNAVVMMAMQKGYDPALIEKMMDLADRNEKNEARKAYHEAMAAFKADPPEIIKDKSVGYKPKDKPFVGYTHASLANVTSKINRALSQHGLSAGWKTDQSESGIQVTCTITHRFGHSESTSLTAMPDATGSKNSIQAVGSTISYLERYTILALTGLATHDQDDDGNAAGSEFITEDQRIQIEKVIVEKGVDVEKFLAYMGVEDTETILAPDFNRAMMALKKAKGKAA